MEPAGPPLKRREYPAVTPLFLLGEDMGIFPALKRNAYFPSFAGVFLNDDGVRSCTRLRLWPSVRQDWTRRILLVKFPFRRGLRG